MTTTPFDIPLRFESLAGFTPTIRPLADGIRASTAARCASCAVIEYLAPDDERIYNGFNQGVAAMGHALHQWWAHQVFAGALVTIEAGIPWAHGVSHDDVVVHDGPHAGVYEVKTHSHPKAKPPSREHLAQLAFRLRLRELAGMILPGPASVVMIGKAGNESGWVRGPWNVELTDEGRAEIDATLAWIDAVMADAENVDLRGDTLRTHGCTRCFPKPRIDAPAGLSDLIDEAGRIRDERNAADAERKLALDAKKALDAEYQTLAARIVERVESDTIAEAIEYDATVNARGVLTITRRYDAAPREAVAS